MGELLGGGCINRCEATGGENRLERPVLSSRWAEVVVEVSSKNEKMLVRGQRCYKSRQEGSDCRSGGTRGRYVDIDDVEGSGEGKG